MNLKFFLLGYVCQGGNTMQQAECYDPSNISLIINYAPLGLVRALSAEFGTQRILVDTGCISLPNDSEVDIMLCIGCGAPSNYHHIRARVTGSHPDGVILAFEDCDTATTTALLPYITIH
jgi:hypothetical protein